jgi:hypothetical protein
MKIQPKVTRASLSFTSVGKVKEGEEAGRTHASRKTSSKIDMKKERPFSRPFPYDFTFPGR